MIPFLKKIVPVFLFVIAIPTHLLSTPSLLDPDNMLAFVKQWLPESPTILEAGGHFGEDTNRMKTVWPDATMYVFEALPSSFQVMVNATQHLSNVKCYPYALTNYSGITTFYIDFHNHAASSIDYPVEWNEHEFDKTPIEVPCTTLDEWASANSISPVDFIWFDLEGHELYVLQKGLDLLKSVKAIYTEISFQPIRKNSCSYFDLRQFLESQGFCEVWKSCETGLFGDALFVKSDLLSD